MATRRILFRFFDAAPAGEDVILWGGGRLTLYAGGVLGSVSASQGAAYARALGAAYAPETDSGRGAGEVDAEAGASSGETSGASGAGEGSVLGAAASGSTEATLGAGAVDPLGAGRVAEASAARGSGEVGDVLAGALLGESGDVRGAGSARVLAGGTPLESGYLPFNGTFGLGFATGLFSGITDTYTIAAKFAQPMEDGGSGGGAGHYFAAGGPGAGASTQARYAGAGRPGATGTSGYWHARTDSGVEFELVGVPASIPAGECIIAIKRTATHAKLRVISGGAVVYTNDVAVAFVAVPDHLSIAALCDVTGAKWSQAGPADFISAIVSSVEVSDAELVAWGAGRNARPHVPGIRSYYVAADAVGASIPDRGPNGVAMALTAASASDIVRTVGDGVPYVALASAGRAGGLVEAEGASAISQASATRGSGAVSLTGAGYLPLGDSSASWGAGSLGYVQGAGLAGLSAGSWGAGLVELEAAGLVSWTAPSGWHCTALVRPWSATGRPAAFACLALVRPWSSTGRPSSWGCLAIVRVYNATGRPL